ncbi:hypothetical protein P43SY_003124 [Pythium insidiosum]|uniref:Alpha-1,3-glucosyltransferase n=1 Tax=Pythium insidiosum TaxID=114742 RepID=A0AAD5QCC9_PYTIN|nr:hypothetical protein P43SY_003124 [Pythium insidiosum]
MKMMTTPPQPTATTSAASMLQRVFDHFERHALHREGVWFVWIVLLLLRWVVGLHAYSGAHTPPMYGDYEAQRHWMEITLQLPPRDWYFNTTDNDLLYWGLDYPPLTAYVSYVFGAIAMLFEPELVELTASRGYESATSKVFMRASVVLCDLILFLPAVFMAARTVSQETRWSRQMTYVVVLLAQPSLLLIDHGHFQYNNVCLGFTALAVALLWQDKEVLASVAFCCALNFKQMALYYAPAVGIYLLSKCLYRRHVVVHVAKLAVVVLATFALLWFPFCVSPRAGETCLSSLAQVVHRIFPFARGLFEDKVANVWCVVDLVLKLKRRLAPTTQMRLCTVATACGFLPSVVDLLRRRPTKSRFLLALCCSSLSFFLFSFQVHEKSILLPLLPVSMLYAQTPLLSSWFSVISTFSMFFLLKKDGLLVPYVALQVLYFIFVVVPALSAGDSPTAAPGHHLDGRPRPWMRIYVVLSTIGMLVIHLAHATVTPPPQYPHIFDYLFAAYSCGHFVLALGYCTFWQWSSRDVDSEPSAAAKLKAE